MLDFIYRFDPMGRDAFERPADAHEARRRLALGNREFARLFELRDSEHSHVHIIPMDPVQFGSTGDRGPPQSPFAVVLGCSDARAPAELLFSQASNDLFVIRVAGTVLGAECLGSIQYAQTNLAESLKVVVVLGHSGCGAATAAVKAFLNPSRYLEIAPTHALRSVIDRLFVSVDAGYQALVDAHGSKVKTALGFREALIEMTTTINAALTALTLRHELNGEASSGLDVAFSVFDLGTRRIRIPVESPLASMGKHDDLCDAPRTPAEFTALGPHIARSDVVRRLLEGADNSAGEAASG